MADVRAVAEQVLVGKCIKDKNMKIILVRICLLPLFAYAENKLLAFMPNVVDT